MEAISYIARLEPNCRSPSLPPSVSGLLFPDWLLLLIDRNCLIALLFGDSVFIRGLRSSCLWQT